MLLLSLTLGCLVQDGAPYVGACAEYPGTRYDYGQIGIGDCLAGPISLHWVDEDTLLVTNANPFRDFVGGSVITVDVAAWRQDAAKRPDGRVAIVPDVHVPYSVGVSTFSDDGVSDESMPGESLLIPDSDLLLVPNRYSPDARNRVWFDRVNFYFVEESGQVYEVGAADGERSLELMSDPVTSTYDAENEQVYIGNITSHTVSVLSVADGQVSLVDGSPVASLSSPAIRDLDGSGSEMELSVSEIVDSEEVLTETWTLTYVEGTDRIWEATADGLLRHESVGQEQWVTATTVDLPVTDLVLSDPTYTIGADGSYLGMVVVQGGIYNAVPSADSAETWGLLSAAALSPRSDNWDAVLGGPHHLISSSTDHLFFDGWNEATGESGIGLATSSDSRVYTRETSGPLLLAGSAGGDHDSVRIADPFVVYDAQADRWRMYYSAFDGEHWSIGHAVSSDLRTWEPDAEPVFDTTAGAAAPILRVDGSGFRMWTSRPTDTGWELGVAWSLDGSDWEDLGAVLELESTDSEPPGVSLQRLSTLGWSVWGNDSGGQELTLLSGDLSEFGGLYVMPSHGFSHGLSASENAETGVQAWSLLSDGTLLLALTDGEGERSIAWGGAGGHVSRPVFTASDSELATTGVHSPTAYEVNGALYMLYAATDDDGLDRIGRATSTDGGKSWTDLGLALDLGEDWDSVRVFPGSVVGDETELTLYYTGFNGTQSRLGLATSTDGGETWLRSEPDEPWLYQGGTPGSFDDSAVRNPFVLRQDGVDHIWYGGFDGELWRLGYATRSVGSLEWVQPADRDGEPKWAHVGMPSTFASESVDRVVLQQLSDGSYQGYVSGWDAPEAYERVGRVFGTSPETLYPDLGMPTAGDQMVLYTHRGDDSESMAIDLELDVGGATFSGQATAALRVDHERGFLYVASEVQNAIYVIDIRDDSDGLFDDSNVFDVEAVLINNNNTGAYKSRDILAPQGSDWIYALNAAPDALVVYDATQIVDDGDTELVFDAPIGVLPLPRASTTVDNGVQTTVEVGPGRMVQVGELLVVSNFNENSLSVIDPRLGTFGQVIGDVENIGENPFAMALSPDGTTLAVANYVGEILDQHVNPSVVLVDMDPDSETFMQPVATLVNE